MKKMNKNNENFKIFGRNKIKILKKNEEIIKICK